MARLRSEHRGLLARDHLTQRALRAAVEAGIGQALQAIGAARRAAVCAACGAACRASCRATCPPTGPGCAGASVQSLTIIDVGCGQRPYSALFGDARVVGVDLNQVDSRPDIIANAMHLPLRSGCADLVFSSQVLEHVPDPPAMVAECCRLLAPGGVLLLTAPFYWPLHEEPHDYHRFTVHGLQALLQGSGLLQVTVLPDCGAVTQVAVSVIELLPRWAWPLRVVINLATPLLQRLSGNRLTTLNYVAWGQKAG